MGMAYNPGVSTVNVDYIGNKGNNTFYWTNQQPWGNFPYLSQHTDTMSPKGSVKYPDGTSPTEPV